MQTMKHLPSVMIWGTMLVTGTAGLFFLPNRTTINSKKYVDLLKDKLELHMNVHNCKIFMQDGAPCYRSKIVSGFLKKKKDLSSRLARQSRPQPHREFMESSEEQGC